MSAVNSHHESHLFPHMFQFAVLYSALDAASSDYGPIEVLPSVFDAIQIAVAQGFVVIEAAGDGGG